MPATAIVNVGEMISGDVRAPLHHATSVLIESGRIAAVGPDEAAVARATTVIDANGMTLIPGLIDSHTHPAIGDFTPRLNTIGWIDSSLHGGVTSMVSTGELHVPGRPRDPVGIKSLAILAAKSFKNAPPSGVKVIREMKEAAKHARLIILAAPSSVIRAVSGKTSHTTKNCTTVMAANTINGAGRDIAATFGNTAEMIAFIIQ